MAASPLAATLVYGRKFYAHGTMIRSLAATQHVDSSAHLVECADWPGPRWSRQPCSGGVAAANSGSSQVEDSQICKISSADSPGWRGDARASPVAVVLLRLTSQPCKLKIQSFAKSVPQIHLVDCTDWPGDGRASPVAVVLRLARFQAGSGGRQGGRRRRVLEAGSMTASAFPDRLSLEAERVCVGFS